MNQMAEDLDDGEFWLPPQFLTDDDDDDFKMAYNGGEKINTGDRNEFSRESYYGFGTSGSCSDLSSTVESVVGSTETESDEEDFITGLTRKMTHSTRIDDLWKSDTGLGYDNQKSWAVAGSPQSTLCTVLDGYGCKQGSSHGSPNCPSPVSPPPPPAATELSRSEAGLDLLCAAAGEVARMKMIENGTGYYQNRGLFGPPSKPSQVSLPLKNPNASTNVGFHSNQPLHYQQLQAPQFQQLKQQQMMKKRNSAVWGQSETIGQYQMEQTRQMVQNRSMAVNGLSQRLSQMAWPSLQQAQQQTGSGMRAVFLGSHNRPKRECTGTGVFLPRTIGNPTETRKKPACSTVLLPDRVVQALNLNLDTLDGAQPRLQPHYNASYTADKDAAIKYRSHVLAAQRSKNVRLQLQPAMTNEVRLPQEWTY